MSIFDDVPDPKTGKTLADKLKAKSIPKITLTFTFPDDGSTYSFPVLANTENAQSVTFNFTPELESIGDRHKLVAETFSIELNYGLGVDP
jgi:hypothetical protein